MMGKIVKIRTMDKVYYKGKGREGEMCGNTMYTILKSEMWTMSTTKEKEGRVKCVDIPSILF